MKWMDSIGQVEEELGEVVGSDGWIDQKTDAISGFRGTERGRQEAREEER